MPKSFFDPSARAVLLARIDRLDATSPARWGKFTAPRMVSHLIDAKRMTLGDLPIPRRRTVLSNRLVRYLLIHLLPMPRGAPTAPQLLTRVPESWPSDIATLKTLIARVAAQEGVGSWQPHPAFGVLSTRDWGVLLHKHTDHHLSQFGV